MTSLPKISIVTPSFNQGQFLEQCIDSILSQNYPNLEFIIMDGGSTDNSVEIIRKYEKYLAYWQSQPDGGHYNAVSEGFRKSTGEVMGWLNSDDMFHPKGLFCIGAVFAEHPEIEFLTGKRIGFDAEGHLLSFGCERQVWCRDSLLDTEFVDRHLFVMQEATYWRRSLWDRAGGKLDLRYNLAADFELWARFSRYARLHTVDALLGGYRYHSNEQRSQQNRETYVTECKNIIARERSIASLDPTTDSIPPALVAVSPVKASLTVLTKDSSPVISIVTPSFNQGEFLEECIDSVLGQNYPNIEYVIMDGGSTDNSVEIIKKYERYLTYWQSKPDGGQYAAINAGFRKTTGDIMAWLNSDDKYHDRSFFIAGYVFQDHQDVQWIMGRPTFWNKHGGIIRVEEFLPSHSRSDFLAKKYDDPFIQQESTFWRRLLWKCAGAYVRDDLQFAGDLELWIRFFRFTELHVVDALLGGYRSHGNQKALLAMEQYIAEAEAVLEQELLLVSKDVSPRMNPAPAALTIDPDTFSHYLSCVEGPSGGFFHVHKYFLQTVAERAKQNYQYQQLLDVKDAELQRVFTALHENESRIAAIEESFGWRCLQFYVRHLSRLKNLIKGQHNAKLSDERWKR